MKISILFLISLSTLIIIQTSLAQTPARRQIIGYVYENNNSGFLNEVKITAKAVDKGLLYSGYSNIDGKFDLWLPVGEQYIITATKKVFQKKNDTIDLRDTTNMEALYLKFPLKRLPGYLLEASIAELVSIQDSTKNNAVTYSLDGVTIEVYNNTVFQEELRLVGHDKHTFSMLLEQGNEYIFMLRKEGYYTKRMRANVNVNGCILCMEGFGTVSPGVAKSLTRNNTMGTLVGNVVMKKVEVGKTVKIDNIYYDYGSSSIRKESRDQLDALAEMMRDNPRIIIELSSHTDSRGGKAVNKRLSQQRAESVVRYILNKAKIESDRINAMGYGEEKLVNSCADGVECSEEMHQQNRRTEFMVIDIKPDDAYLNRSLASIMQEENTMRMVKANDETSFMVVEKKVGEKPTTAPNQVKPEVIPSNYSGYKVQLMTQLESPDIKHPIFSAFSPVYLDMDHQNRIAFLVGDFSTENAADIWRKKQLASYPQAIVVYFAKGIRQ